MPVSIYILSNLMPYFFRFIRCIFAGYSSIAGYSFYTVYFFLLFGRIKQYTGLTIVTKLNTFHFYISGYSIAIKHPLRRTLIRLVILCSISKQHY